MLGIVWHAHPTQAISGKMRQCGHLKRPLVKSSQVRDISDAGADCSSLEAHLRLHFERLLQKGALVGFDRRGDCAHLDGCETGGIMINTLC